MKRTISHLAICVSCALLVSACETIPTEKPQTAEETAANALAQAAERTKAKEQELDQALNQYNAGQFAQAIAALAPLIDAAELPQASQLRAIKFTAFSQCNLGQSVLCRVSFEQALKLDSGFQLADTEISHPLWGAEFRRAQRATRIAPASTR